MENKIIKGTFKRRHISKNRFLGMDEIKGTMIITGNNSTCCKIISDTGKIFRWKINEIIFEKIS